MDVALQISVQILLRNFLLRKSNWFRGNLKRNQLHSLLIQAKVMEFYGTGVNQQNILVHC